MALSPPSLFQRCAREAGLQGPYRGSMWDILAMQHRRTRSGIRFAGGTLDGTQQPLYCCFLGSEAKHFFQSISRECG